MLKFHGKIEVNNLKNILRIEINKLLHTKRFWICLGIGIVIASFNTIYMLSAYQEFVKEKLEFIQMYGNGVNPILESSTLYNGWLGNEAFTLSFSVYYFIFPLLVVVPYGTSLYGELKSGYIKNIIVRMNKRVYWKAKYITAFLSGGLVMTVPLLFNILLDAMILPALKPDSVYPYYAMLETGFLSDMYSEHPLIFNGIYFLLAFCFCGLLATMSYLCNFFAKNKLINLVLPFGVIMLLHYVSSFISSKYDWSPLYCIHATPVRYQNSGYVLLVYLGSMILLTLVVGIIKGRKTYEIL